MEHFQNDKNSLDDSFEDLEIGHLEENIIIQEMLSSLSAQRAEHSRDLLAAHGKPKGGTKEQLEDRIRSSLYDGSITLTAVAEVLDRVEPWGRQTAYLYSTPSKVPSILKDRVSLQSHINKIGWDLEVNSSNVIFVPKTRTVRSIHLIDERLRLEWIDGRQWNQRVPSFDFTETVDGRDLIFAARQSRIQRAVSAFEWNLIDDTAQLFIHRLPSGSNYAKEEQSLRDFLKPLVDIDTFDRLRMKKALTRLKASGEVRERKSNFVDGSGYKLSMQSSGRDSDLSDNTDLSDVSELMRASRKFGPSFLNCFWKADGPLTREVHTHLNALESSVNFFGQYSEVFVRHVLSRIRRSSR